MQLIIRDDDISYWTKVTELDALYGDYIKKGAKITLAVVPNMYKSYYNGDRKKFYQDNVRKFIYENKELVDYVKDGIKGGWFEVIQHGYDHSYCIKYKSEIKFIDKATRILINNKDTDYVAECLHKTPLLLKKDLMNGRQILEDTFNTPLKAFAPPSNSLNKKSSAIIESMGLNISGSISTSFNRKVNYSSLKNYATKTLWKFKNNSSYPYILKYKNNKELVSFAFTPKTNLVKYLKQMNTCEQADIAFTLATHYWDILENKDLEISFNKLLNSGNYETILFSTVVK